MDMLNSMAGVGPVYEPTMSHLATEKRGDTVHIDVIDREGNMVSVTPSGGWLQSSPIVPRPGVLPQFAGADVLDEAGPADIPCAGENGRARR